MQTIGVNVIHMPSPLPNSCWVSAFRIWRSVAWAESIPLMFVPFRFGAVFGSIDLTKKIAHPLRWNSNTFRMFCVSKHVDWLQTNWPKQGRQRQLEKQLQHHRSAGPEVNSSSVENIFWLWMHGGRNRISLYNTMAFWTTHKQITTARANQTYTNQTWNMASAKIQNYHSIATSGLYNLAARKLGTQRLVPKPRRLKTHKNVANSRHV